MTKFKAFGLHLMVSLAVACIALLITFFVWYPAPLHKAAGVVGVFLLLIAVDVVLGPLLTLVVFNTGKKTLKFDLAVILLLQLAAFIYGFAAVAQGRPVWLVYSVGRFDMVQAVDVYMQDEHVAPAYSALSWVGPVLVGAVLPDDPQERSDLVLESALGGVDLPQRPRYYRALDTLSADIEKRASALDALEKYNNAERVREVLVGWPEANAWMPLMAAGLPMVVLLSISPGEGVRVLAVEDLRPW